MTRIRLALATALLMISGPALAIGIYSSLSVATGI
jgi:hypothetical protein